MYIYILVFDYKAKVSHARLETRGGTGEGELRLRSAQLRLTCAYRCACVCVGLYVMCVYVCIQRCLVYRYVYVHVFLHVCPHRARTSRNDASLSIRVLLRQQAYYAGTSGILVMFLRRPIFHVRCRVSGIPMSTPL